MRKILGVLVVAIALLLTGCIDAGNDLTEEEIGTLIEEYFNENKETLLDSLTEEEIDAIVEAYFQENIDDVVSDYVTENKDILLDDLTSEEIELIVLQWLVDNPVENFVSTTYDLSSFEEAIISMLNTSRQGVLGITAISDYLEDGATGSGVVYKKEGTSTYYMVTNEHVVVHTQTISGNEETVVLQYEATSISIDYEKNGIIFTISDDVTLMGYDATTDLAVIRFESDEDFSVIPFGDSYDLEIGQTVFAIGNPLGIQYYGTVTSGILSGEARFMKDGDFDATLLQHDAAISPGNSGGALVDINGNLIGINNRKIVSDDVSNIGFAIPVNTVKRIVEDIEDDGIVVRPYLGISSNVYVNSCGQEYGVCVEVLEGGAAEAAGLITDDIIIGYKNDGATEFIEINNFDNLREAILNSSVREFIQIKYIRYVDVEGELVPQEFESLLTELNVHPDDQ